MSKLRDRLKRIKEQGADNREQIAGSSEQRAGNKEQITDNREQVTDSRDKVADNRGQKTGNNEQYLKNLIKCGWQSCGFKVMKRVKKRPSNLTKIKKLPLTLPIFIPDLHGHDLPCIEDFVFFDLETTGLSGGAGTVAFLAAFGKIVLNKLHITQYLLLDYSGQNDFLENIIKEFNNDSFFASYNGKSFDSQIINSMCLVNRIKPPLYKHVDLVHPSRRLWKNIINDCSQSSIEKNILDINRKDDIPGALAPDIWFEFLKTEKTERLIGICDHNISDITGLAEILSKIIIISNAPFNNNFDIQKLAIYWRKYLRTNDNLNIEEFVSNGEKLLKLAADKNYSRAVYIYSYDQYKKGNYAEALKYIKKGLKLFDGNSKWHNKLLRRKERLDKKLNN